MRKFKRYLKKMKIVGYCCISVAGLACMITLPVKGKEPNQQYYKISVQNETIGVYETEQAAMEDIVEARTQVGLEQSDLFLSDLKYSIEKTEITNVKELNTDGNVDKLYQLLKDHAVDTKVSAYTVKINEFIMTLASRQEVITVLDGVKNRYDLQREFELELVEKVGSKENVMTVAIINKGMESATGIVNIEFEDEIEIMPTYVKGDEIVSVEEAIAALTKEQETNTVYQVVQGDCLSLIAENNGMTTDKLMVLNQLTDAEYINIGDELIITIPEPELSVIMQQETSYTEHYQVPVVYVDNDSWYKTKQVVVSEGTEGIRDVVARITYRDGSEQGREILQENLIEESNPKIIERGTQVPPTYIKPLTGGSFSSSFGARWGRQHKGVDWSCPTGTAIKASCGGTVVSAGWQNGYGNCIVLSHSDGKLTKYAHLSQILVSAGEKVAQGDKIALSGNTGNSTGPHLHFEILVNGIQENPLSYLN